MIVLTIMWLIPMQWLGKIAKFRPKWRILLLDTGLGSQYRRSVRARPRGRTGTAKRGYIHLEKKIDHYCFPFAGDPLLWWRGNFAGPEQTCCDSLRR